MGLSMAIELNVKFFTLKAKARTGADPEKVPVPTMTIFKNRMKSSFSSNHPGAIHPIFQFILVQNSWRGKELNTFCPPNSSDDLCLFLLFFYPSSIGIS